MEVDLSPLSSARRSAKMDGMESQPKPAGRLRITAYAAWQFLLAVPALVLFALSMVAGVLVVVWVGILFLLLTIPATRWIANQHRKMAANVLGSPMPANYRPARPGGPIARLRGWATDPMTWRDQLWLLVSFITSVTLSLMVLILFVSVVTLALWWYGGGPLMRLRSMIDRAFLTRGRTELLEERVQVLTESRAVSVDHSAAELRRIERDLHDGAQARLVALGMNLGMADDLFASDPEAARRLVAEARATTGAALGDLRSVVRGIHPPVLADRGLVGAIEALALDMAVPVSVRAALSGRPPAPVESAVYFAVAECLANTGKHSGAAHVWAELSHDGTALRVLVGDDGVGGADPNDGTGMTGVMRRLSAFDGTMRVSSPIGGPTLVTLEVPCALSSPKTTPSSGTV
jgi:signal transduction histidine kinase